MCSGAYIAKKHALCRYYVNSGTCLYGEDCQFLHDAPLGRKIQSVNNHHSSDLMETTENGVIPSDANNGDQYFNATFAGIGPASNGIPEFPGFPPKGGGGGGGQERAAGPLQPYSQDNGAPLDEVATLTQDFASLTVPPPRLPGVALPMKGRNPGASEFIPKSSGSPAGLTHSASTPSFNTFGQQHIPSLQPGTPVSHGIPLSAGTSPIASPGMSPTASPKVGRKTASPATPLTTSTPTSNATPILENVGGTTYFYTQEALSSQGSGMVMPNFTMYPSILPHVAHMKPKANMPSFFMPDELKVEVLNRHALSLAQIDSEQVPDIPQQVDNYHCLVPLEPPPANPMHKSSTFGYPTTVYKATNTKDGLAYCLRRIHGYRLVNTKCMALIDLWKKITHSNMVQLREVFTTKAFNDHSMVFVYDFHPAAETLMMRHFSGPSAHLSNGYSNPYNLDGSARPYSAGKGRGPRQHAGLLPESLIWSYVVQLSSALRTIHAHGLACRVMDPTKILLTDKSRIRLNCVGIFDVLSFDASQTNQLAMMPHYQQEDLISLGKVVLALACNSVIGIQREHIQASMELVARNYSADLKNLILYLLTNSNRAVKSVNDIMPMIGARFYTQLDAAQLRSDVLENELAKEVENGRLFRLISKLGIINDRPEFAMDPSWSETGDRYMLKLFRDYLFHQVDESAHPWIDMAHVVQTLNKLDAGVPEKVCLMSRDEQNVLVVTYTELKQCFESAFAELFQSSQGASFS